MVRVLYIKDAMLFENLKNILEIFIVRVFPWIIDIFEIPAYYFYKVIEVLIRAEEGLSRDIVKHLNHVRCNVK